MHNKCNALESSWNPGPWKPQLGPWKKCLPWNQSLLPERLGSDTLKIHIYYLKLIQFSQQFHYLNCYPHFIDKETEPQEGLVSCLKLMELGFKSSYCGSTMYILKLQHYSISLGKLIYLRNRVLDSFQSIYIVEGNNWTSEYVDILSQTQMGVVSFPSALCFVNTPIITFITLYFKVLFLCLLLLFYREQLSQPR